MNNDQLTPSLADLSEGERIHMRGVWKVFPQADCYDYVDAIVFGKRRFGIINRAIFVNAELSDLCDSPKEAWADAYSKLPSPIAPVQPPSPMTDEEFVRDAFEGKLVFATNSGRVILMDGLPQVILGDNWAEARENVHAMVLAGQLLKESRAAKASPVQPSAVPVDSEKQPQLAGLPNDAQTPPVAKVTPPRVETCTEFWQNTAQYWLSRGASYQEVTEMAWHAGAASVSVREEK